MVDLCYTLDNLFQGSSFHPLSECKATLLTCVVKGMSIEEIASSLDINLQTVKNHILSILRELGVEDRTLSVVSALQ